MRKTYIHRSYPPNISDSRGISIDIKKYQIVCTYAIISHDHHIAVLLSGHYKQIKSSYRMVNIKSKSTGGAKKKTVGAKKKSAKITKMKKVTHTKKKSPKKVAKHPDTEVVVHATAAA